MSAVIINCYYAEDAKFKPKFSCKSVSKKQNPMSWERYLEALNRSINVATNKGFRVHHHKTVTYTQDKLGLIVCYDKCIIAPDGICMELLR